jgi:hypothetical protein
MQRVASQSASKTSSEVPEWLEDQVYSPKRARTVALVKQSIDALAAEGQRVSVATIMKRARELDPKGKGVSHTAILNNPEARAYYEQHRTWQATRKSRSKTASTVSTSPHTRIELGRDLGRVRQRYLLMAKQELAERLIQTEQLYAEQHEHWLQGQDEVLTWRLQAEQWRKRAEQAEAKLAEQQNK